MVKRACVVTTTRAEYGLLRPLMQALQMNKSFELQLIVSGTHLSPEFGLTLNGICEDGFKVNEQIDMLVSGDTPSAVSKSLGLMVLGISDAFRRLTPDFIIILGDRYEILGVAAAAVLFNIPIVHLHGGEITEGAVDDSFRHAITKLSHLHFTSTDVYRKRVIQLGEQPELVFNVGAIGVDNIRCMKLLSRAELENSLNIDLKIPYFLVTYHPATVTEGDLVSEVDALILSLLDVPDTQVIITLANADVGGRTINQRFEYWAKLHVTKIHTFASLGQLRYLSAIKHSLGVVGNSSSGILEAPSLGVGTLNIGSRQDGRIQALSVVNSANNKEDIVVGLHRLLSKEHCNLLTTVKNPYGNGYAVNKIMQVLINVSFDKLNKKIFYDQNLINVASE